MPSAHDRAKVRHRWLALWIAVLQTALENARLLAAGVPLDTPSRYPNRRRWQLIWDIADLREWRHATDAYSLAGIASVLHACLGPGAFDEEGFSNEIDALLEAASVYTIMPRRADLSAKAVPRHGLPEDDKVRVLRRPRSASEAAVEQGGEKACGRQAVVGGALGEDSPDRIAPRRLAVPM